MDGSHEDGPYLGERPLGRRHFLRAATAGAGGLLLPLASFAAPEQVHDLRGKVTINGAASHVQIGRHSRRPAS